MSIRSAARNFLRASRNASSGVGRRGSGSAASSRWSLVRGRAVLMLGALQLDGSCDAVEVRLLVLPVAQGERSPAAVLRPRREADLARDVHGQLEAHVDGVG